MRRTHTTTRRDTHTHGHPTPLGWRKTPSGHQLTAQRMRPETRRRHTHLDLGAITVVPSSFDVGLVVVVVVVVVAVSVGVGVRWAASEGTARRRFATGRVRDDTGPRRACCAT